MHGLWSTLVSYAAALLLGMLPFVARRGELRRQPLTLLWLALAAGWCNVSFVMAVLEGTIVRVLLLFYLSPIWSVLLARLILGERVAAQARWAFSLAIIGALTMLWDPTIGLPWPSGPGDWLAVSSGIAFAITNVMVRRLQQVSVPVKNVASWCGVLLVAAIWLGTLDTDVTPNVTSSVWLGAVALGLFGFYIMTYATQYGVTHMPIHRSAVIMLFELVAGAASSYWLTSEQIAPLEWFGGVLIIGAAYWTARLQTHE